jgi:DNA invertase Pin-like site-specific DNA recombinase
VAQKCKCGIYIRPSYSDIRQTIEIQSSKLVNYCKEQDWEYEIYVDETVENQVTSMQQVR